MLEIKHVSVKRQNNSILADITVQIPQPSVISIIGPSGAGKTTLLRCLAGLEKYEGHIEYGTPQPILGYVEQHPTLFPHLTVAENIAYPLRLRHRPTTEIQQRVATLLERCALVHCAQRRPHEISGGEQRRAMLARAFIYEPAVLLLDEPFAAVDAILRVELVRWLKQELPARTMTVLYVTHDITEARFISDQVLILDHGNHIAFATWSALDQAPHPLIKQLLQTHF